MKKQFLSIIAGLSLTLGSAAHAMELDTVTAGELAGAITATLHIMTHFLRSDHEAKIEAVKCLSRCVYTPIKQDTLYAISPYLFNGDRTISIYQLVRASEEWHSRTANRFIADKKPIDFFTYTFIDANGDAVQYSGTLVKKVPLVKPRNDETTEAYLARVETQLERLANKYARILDEVTGAGNEEIV
jgi:hypothetical protein